MCLVNATPPRKRNLATAAVKPAIYRATAPTQVQAVAEAV